MASITYDLSSVSVADGKFSVTADTAIGSATLTSVGGAAVIKEKHGLFYAGSTASEYDFQALTGGEFTFTDGANASIASFDGSAATSAVKITVDSSKNAKLTNVTTGSGKDVVSVTSVTGGTFDLGAGADSIAIAAGTATVTLGDGKDTISIADATNTGVEITDYNFADDTIQFAATSVAIDYDKAQFTAKGFSASVTVDAEMNNGVYELKLNGTSATTHYVRTNTSAVDYVAEDAIDFESDDSTTSLNLTLADKTANNVSVGATDGTVNIALGKAGTAANSINIGSTSVELGLGISKKSGEVSVSVAGKAASLDDNDTLYLLDSGKLDDLTFSGGDIAYGTATVKGGYDSVNGGQFNYNIGGQTGVLLYGDDTNKKVEYTDGVSYYANASVVDASNYDGDVVLSLNGDTDDAFAKTVTAISGVQSGLVAGRHNEANNISVSTAAGKKTEIAGGIGGGDTIDLSAADEESTNVIWYSLGDGKDTVNGFKNGDNSIYFHNATAAASILNDVLKVDSAGKATLTLVKGKDELTLDSVASKTVAFTDASSNSFKVAFGDGTSVAYAADANIYKHATTLTVKGEDDLIIYTGANNDQYGYFDGITKIDASEAKGTLALSGSNVNGMEIIGGTGVNNMWGGGDKVQTLTGNEDAVNVFWFGTGDGHDTAQHAKAEDGINLYNVEKIDDVAVKASSNYFTVTVGSDSLKVNVDGTAADVLEKFTFADKAGVLYTYNTKTSKFQQK